MVGEKASVHGVPLTGGKGGHVDHVEAATLLVDSWLRLTLTLKAYMIQPPDKVQNGRKDLGISTRYCCHMPAREGR